jgi:pyrroloquinoline-quinone synthase
MPLHAVNTENEALLSLEQLRAALRQVGEERYHHQHPFHLLMHEGTLSRGQLQAWALNRYYYQSAIPIKDAIILSRSEDPEFRRDAERVARKREILPATRYAVNEYLHIVRTRPLLEAVASSLTELFSRDLITLRMDRLRQHYPWLAGGLDYFEARLEQAPEDAAFAIRYVHENAKTRGEQEKAIQALRDKCDILWAQLDALYFAYVQPGWPPPGAFRIEK